MIPASRVTVLSAILAVVSIGSAHAQSPQAAPQGIVPAQPKEFEHAGILEAWGVYADRLSFGQGQTLALVDDGCRMEMAEWRAIMPGGVPKVRVTHDAVDGDDDPKHEGRGYHGSTLVRRSSSKVQASAGCSYRKR